MGALLRRYACLQMFDFYGTPLAGCTDACLLQGKCTLVVGMCLASFCGVSSAAAAHLWKLLETTFLLTEVG